MNPERTFSFRIFFCVPVEGIPWGCVHGCLSERDHKDES